MSINPTTLNSLLAGANSEITGALSPLLSNSMFTEDMGFGGLVSSFQEALVGAPSNGSVNTSAPLTSLLGSTSSLSTSNPLASLLGGTSMTGTTSPSTTSISGSPLSGIPSSFFASGGGSSSSDVTSFLASLPGGSTTASSGTDIASMFTAMFTILQQLLASNNAPSSTTPTTPAATTQPAAAEKKAQVSAQAVAALQQLQSTANALLMQISQMDPKSAKAKQAKAQLASINKVEAGLQKVAETGDPNAAKAAPKATTKKPATKPKKK